MKNTTFKMRVEEEWLEKVRVEADRLGQSVAEFIRSSVDIAIASEDSVLPEIGVQTLEKGKALDYGPPKYDGDAAGVKKRMSAGVQEINKGAFKPGVAIDQWGNKRSLAKPGKK